MNHTDVITALAAARSLNDHILATADKVADLRTLDGHTPRRYPRKSETGQSFLIKPLSEVLNDDFEIGVGATVFPIRYLWSDGWEVEEQDAAKERKIAREKQKAFEALIPNLYDELRKLHRAFAADEEALTEQPDRGALRRWRERLADPINRAAAASRDMRAMARDANHPRKHWAQRRHSLLRKAVRPFHEEVYPRIRHLEHMAWDRALAGGLA